MTIAIGVYVLIALAVAVWLLWAGAGDVGILAAIGAGVIWPALAIVFLWVLLVSFDV